MQVWVSAVRNVQAERERDWHGQVRAGQEIQSVEGMKRKGWGGGTDNQHGLE